MDYDDFVIMYACAQRMWANGTTVPLIFYEALIGLGFKLNRRYLEKPRRPTCTGVKRDGSQCKNQCAPGMVTCRVHNPNRPKREPPVFYAVCQKLTLKGDRCKCAVFKNYDMCQSHARKEGLLPPRPECPICYEKIAVKDHVITDCKHNFHRKCMDSWCNSRHPGANPLRTRFDCPMCRTQTYIHKC